VNGYLLDTNAALFALGTPSKLTSQASAAILSGPNFLSVASYWEVMIKSMKGKLDVGDPRAWWEFAVQRLAAATLQIRTEHVTRVQSLPPIHKDPFDRMLIVQAMVEGLTLISTDKAVAGYSKAGLEIIS
jgi:PIN domain nuclease of toxin-antitoxin system